MYNYNRRNKNMDFDLILRTKSSNEISNAMKNLEKYDFEQIYK